MNKTQRKIFFRKILPKFIILAVVIVGLLSIVGARIWSNKYEKEQKEWWSKPENREKWNKALEENGKAKSDKKSSQNQSNSKQSNNSQTNTKVDYTNLLKPNISEQSANIKTINLIKFPIPDGWGIEKAIHETSIDFYNVIFQSYNNENGLISIMSQKPHKYITDLKEYSDYQNEKLVRNMKPTGLILTSKKITKQKWNGVDAVYEFYDGFHNPTSEEMEIIAINFYYKNYAYTIYYSVNDKTVSAINNTRLI